MDSNTKTFRKGKKFRHVWEIMTNATENKVCKWWVQGRIFHNNSGMTPWSRQFIHLLFDSSAQHLFIEHLLHARCCSRQWEYKGGMYEMNDERPLDSVW